MNLKKDMADYLQAEGLGDVSEEVSEIVMDFVLSWKDNVSDNPNDTKAIIAFSFGFRFDEHGNRMPGTVNEMLAAKVMEHYRGGMPVFAQWEIAKCLTEVPQSDLHVINPNIRRETGDVEYLSSEGVLDAVIAKGLNPKVLNPVLVIAHRYHLLRCARLAREHGFTVVTNPDDMPFKCDSESGQLWTVDRKTYIVSDIISRLAAYRKKVLYPHAASCYSISLGSIQTQ